MEKVIQNDMKLELFEMIDQNVTFDHAIINWPAVIGQQCQPGSISKIQSLQQ